MFPVISRSHPEIKLKYTLQCYPVRINEITLNDLYLSEPRTCEKNQKLYVLIYRWVPTLYQDHNYSV